MSKVTTPRIRRRPIPMAQHVVRFWDRVQETDGCWLWPGWKHPDGYGYFTVNYRNVLTHRFAYESAIGPIPDGMQVLHQCDVPACVRPDHLFLGTHRDNMVDMGRKERACGTKLTADDARTILRLAGTMTQGQIAAQLGVSEAAVWMVVRRKTWKHVS